MNQTQDALSKHQHNELSGDSKMLGEEQNKLSRETCDKRTNRECSDWREETLREAAGIWKHRVDVPDSGELRAEWDRNT